MITTDFLSPTRAHRSVVIVPGGIFRRYINEVATGTVGNRNHSRGDQELVNQENVRTGPMLFS
jgi:hypothetical protein